VKSREQRAESREERRKSREKRIEHRAESREQRAESREQRAESREQRAEKKEQRAEGREKTREQRSESRERTQNRDQKAESRGQRGARRESIISTACSFALGPASGRANAGEIEGPVMVLAQVLVLVVQDGFKLQKCKGGNHKQEKWQPSRQQNRECVPARAATASKRSDSMGDISCHLAREVVKDQRRSCQRKRPVLRVGDGHAEASGGWWAKVTLQQERCCQML
jgi:ABC-type transport system involved in cytochrome bd biosynthesis fused ATPase/permease subunit